MFCVQQLTYRFVLLSKTMSDYLALILFFFWKNSYCVSNGNAVRSSALTRLLTLSTSSHLFL